MKACFAGSRTILAGFVAVIAVSAGCNVLKLFRPVEHQVPARVKADLDGKKLVVVPFSFGERGFYDWSYGVTMAWQVESILQQKLPKTNLVSAAVLEPVLASVSYRDIDALALSRYGEADYVLVTGFDTWQAREPGSLNWMQGKAEFVMEVIDVASPGSPAYRERMTVYYPPRGPGRAEGLTNVSAVEVYDRLAARTSDLIAKRFYKHTVKATGINRGE